MRETLKGLRGSLGRPSLLRHPDCRERASMGRQHPLPTALTHRPWSADRADFMGAMGILEYRLERLGSIGHTMLRSLFNSLTY
jgi:hypothetical protein